MATTFQLKRSSVEGKQPNVADLQVGELAVNLADGILYSKNTAGNIVVVGSSTTSNVTEGVNLYFTNTRAVSAFTAGSGLVLNPNGLISSTVLGTGAVDSVNGEIGSVVLTTANISEQNNLYFTNTRAISAFTAGTGILIESNGFIAATTTTGETGGFVSSTLVNYPTGDYGSGEGFVSPSGLSDAFGVSLVNIYDCMEPIGRLLTEDFEALT